MPLLPFGRIETKKHWYTSGALYCWAAENEQMVAALSDERIQLEKQRYIYEQHIAGIKRQNLIKKACMAIVKRYQSILTGF